MTGPRSLRCWILLALAVVGGGVAAQDVTVMPRTAPDLTEETFESWREAILPTEDEQRWRDVAWRTSFWAGVLDAHRERKPIVLWVMNGHPLGHT